MNQVMHTTARLLVACGSVAAIYPVDAAEPVYPNRPIRMVIPFAPGASNDITARLIAPRLSEALGYSVVVDNRGGAGGVLGADLVAKAQPDGYTLLMGSPGPLTVNPVLMAKLPYQPQRDFAAVTLIAIVPAILEVNPALPAKSVKELIALAHATPGKLAYASAGVGSVPHLAGELFKLIARVDVIHVPYKGSSPAITDLLGGQVSMFFDNMASAVPYVKAGRLRALAITTPRRSAALPEVPTMIEAGVPAYEAYSWNGVVVPAAAPKPVVERLAKEIAAVLALPEIGEKMKALGAEVVGNSPAAFAAFMEKESVKWGRVVREANIKPE
jgi:tripartite-type tricarboxylate transporter receptor subunit TctC